MPLAVLDMRLDRSYPLVALLGRRRLEPKLGVAGARQEFKGE